MEIFGWLTSLVQFVVKVVSWGWYILSVTLFQIPFIGWMIEGFVKMALVGAVGYILYRFMPRIWLHYLGQGVRTLWAYVGPWVMMPVNFLLRRLFEYGVRHYGGVAAGNTPGQVIKEKEVIEVPVYKKRSLVRRLIGASFWMLVGGLLVNEWHAPGTVWPLMKSAFGQVMRLWA